MAAQAGVRWHPLTSGVTTRWLASANGVSVWTIQRWRKRALAAGDQPPALEQTIELAIEMARLRPANGIMPALSRMAIAQLAHEGRSYKELMQLFACSEVTVWRAIKTRSQSFDVLTHERLLTHAHENAKNRKFVQPDGQA